MSDAEEHVEGGPRRRPVQERQPDEGAQGSRLTAVRAARSAVAQLAQLTGRTLESVVGIRSEDGTFTVVIEAVEDPRIPSTADVLAEYEVQLDEEGGLLGYRRRARYVRGSTEEV